MEYVALIVIVWCQNVTFAASALKLLLLYAHVSED